MGSEENTLLIRHLPAQLSDEEKEELLQHFGAIRVKVMGTKGTMKNTAFVTFSDNKAATMAMSRLHQLEILDCRLVVEFAKKSLQKYFPSMSDIKRKRVPDKTQTKKTEEKSQTFPSEDAMYKKWSVNYPKNPKLCYLYPPPTVSILTNIANALASCPKFYVQVLHLMNKMNLPAPFGAVTPTPPIPTEEPVRIREPDNIEMQEMEVSSTEESEIESEGESQKPNTKKTPLKRHIRRKKKISNKRPKLLQNIQIPAPAPTSVPVMDPSKVFENPQQQPQMKKIELRIPDALHEPHSETRDSELPLGVPKESSTVGGGFGKINPMKQFPDIIDMTESELPYIVNHDDFLSVKNIKKGRISKDEMKNFSVFKKYETGERTKRLYLKNLTKHTTEQELVNIYGNYIDWNSETEKTMFDIRLMKEGRMKGQCFITFPTEEAAEKALHDTNGYLLNNKPIAVQFARSAKAKDAGDEKEK